MLYVDFKKIQPLRSIETVNDFSIPKPWNDPFFQGYSFVVDEVLVSELQQEDFVSDQPVPGVA